MSTLFIECEPNILRQDLHVDDRQVPLYTQYECTEPLSLEEYRDWALTEFHCSVPIKRLDDFDIRVFLEI